MNPGVAEEVSKQVGGFMDIMRAQPLSLALVAQWQEALSFSAPASPRTTQ